MEINILACNDVVKFEQVCVTHQLIIKLIIPTVPCSSKYSLLQIQFQGINRHVKSTNQICFG